jgi:hypothetical protein
MYKHKLLLIRINFRRANLIFGKDVEGILVHAAKFLFSLLALRGIDYHEPTLSLYSELE